MNHHREIDFQEFPIPRKARFCPAGYPVHIIQRGNNRQAIFTCEGDLAAYANWLAEGAERFEVSIHGWVLWSPHHLYRGLGSHGNQPQRAWRTLINEALDIDLLAKIRHCADTGLVLGAESFREQVRRLRT